MPKLVCHGSFLPIPCRFLFHLVFVCGCLVHWFLCFQGGLGEVFLWHYSCQSVSLWLLILSLLCQALVSHLTGILLHVKLHRVFVFCYCMVGRDLGHLYLPLRLLFSFLRWLSLFVVLHFLLIYYQLDEISDELSCQIPSRTEISLMMPPIRFKP